MKIYDPDGVSIMFAGVPHEGFGENEIVEIEARDAIERAHYGAAYPEIVRLREESAAMARRLRGAINALETIARGEAWNPRETARFCLDSLK